MSTVFALPVERPDSVAIIGSGIAGLSVAEALHPAERVTVYEAAGWIGGHSHTVEVDDEGERLAIDTGFIVCNDRTYPNFLALLGRLRVETQPATMSFSLTHESSGLEYGGSDLNSLFAQRRNLLSPSFLRMLIDIVRFNRDARRSLAEPDDGATLGEWLAARRYGRALGAHYVVPMGRAIWSAQETALLNFPARFFIDFFVRHGLLSISDRPQWRSVVGGSREYVRALAAPFRSRIRIDCPVVRVQRHAHGVSITTSGGAVEHYDAVVFACHADTALALLADPTTAEREILGSFPFEANEAILHTDASVLPRSPRARAAWNYHLRRDAHPGCAVTYDMNVLQSLPAARRYLVSLNLGDRIDSARVLARFRYDHPVYTPAGVAAQARHAEISGPNRSFYCGAYWRNGFHEDGLVSALSVLKQYADRREEHAQRAISRLG